MSSIEEALNCFDLGIKGLVESNNHEAINEFAKSIEILEEIDYRILNENLNYYARAYYNRGVAYSNLKDYRKALLDYNKAIKIDSFHTNAYYNRGSAYYGLKKYDRAIVDYSKAIMIDPNYTNAYYLRGCAYFDYQSYEKSIIDISIAIKDFERSKEIEPNHAHAYFVRGCAYDTLENYAKAMLDYNNAIKIDSKLAVAYKSRGDIYSKVGKVDRADHDYKKAKELGL